MSKRRENEPPFREKQRVFGEEWQKIDGKWSRIKKSIRLRENISFPIVSSVFTKSPGPLIDGDGDANKQKFAAARGWLASSVIGFVMCVSDAGALWRIVRIMASSKKLSTMWI